LGENFFKVEVLREELEKNWRKIGEELEKNAVGAND